MKLRNSTIRRFLSHLKTSRKVYDIASNETNEFQELAEKLHKQVVELEEKIVDLKYDYKALKEEHSQLYALMTKESAMRAKYECELQSIHRNGLEKQFTAIKGDYPILWVNFEDAEALDSKIMVQMSDRIKRAAPDIDLVLFTHGVASLREMDDSDLQRLGLYRDIQLAVGVQ